MPPELIGLVSQWGGLGALIAAIIFAITKYWDHKPAWSKALLEQQDSLTKRLDKMQARIDALEDEKTAREGQLIRLQAKLYRMVSRVTLLEGLLRANDVNIPEYPNEFLEDELLEDTTKKRRATDHE